MRAGIVGCSAAVGWLLALDAAYLSLGGAKQAFDDMASKMCVVEPLRPWQSGLVALAAYGLLAAAVCDLVLAGRTPAATAVRGACLGLLVYGVFDATNLVVFGRGYGVALAISDVLWGVCLLGSAALVGALAARAAGAVVTA